MIVKAREGGENYVYSILTGFHQTPPKGFTVTANKYYNPYFEGWNISMPPPLADNGVTYSDGTKATIEQEAHDVATFLAWASDPKMEERKRMGLSVLIFLVVLAGVSVCRLPQGLGRRALGAGLVRRECVAHAHGRCPHRLALLRGLLKARAALAPSIIMAKTVLGIIGGWSVGVSRSDQPKTGATVS